MSDSRSALYGRLTEDQQAEFSKAVVGKLKSLIGGYGELSVLAEYIMVMLQSSRPADQIQMELDAFLQDQSKPFTEWIFKKLIECSGEDNDALLTRAVKDARKGTEANASKRKKSGQPKEKGEKLHKEKKSGRERGIAVAVAADANKSAEAAAATGARRRRGEEPSRSRSRRRRRKDKPSAAALVPAADAAEAAKAADRKAILTPNVQFGKDPYAKDDTTEAAARFSYRADPSSDRPPPPLQGGYGPPGYHGDAAAVSAAPPGHYGPPGELGHPIHPPPGYHGGPVQPAVQSSRSRGSSMMFEPKKWRVIRENTMVRASEALDSAEVQSLKEGEIVEQVTHAYRSDSGIVRIQIRHPASPLFPNPIGWVTQDATAAGGPKFLEPGPEPMARMGAYMQPPPQISCGGKGFKGGGKGGDAGPWGAPAWKGCGKGDGKGVEGPGASAVVPKYGNLCWTPGSGTSGAAMGVHTLVATQ